ncbi:hypothetical protein SAMN04488074_13110 [Lentzea albidocapillata subsp. violacea]|uniref:YgjP-like metallopeptidase domain-containing protein n=1 Tax=Lentzea albidocapillata subsp. violacea TaxID=128104 RepID=A0A1G9XQ75_9PSEU|nr:YgjP-like metallopeptidase domain-containing protein [Lentzea albidocapillata]SDM98924.1 hypothetical protein SAMN04488074_13110 [Lentzea albidocapillata subsp. violacea]
MADPDQVVRFVRSRRRWITDKVDTAARLAPDYPVKALVDGAEFDLLGRRYRLQLVAAPPADTGQLPAATADRILYVRAEPPGQVRRAIIDWYREVGLAWVKREGRPYELDGRIEGLRYEVRDLGRRHWGLYRRMPQHITALHWAVFGLPVHLVEYVLVHEQAHATRPGGRSHGSAWQRRMNLWMPEWRQRQTELAEVGRHCWLGDHQEHAGRQPAAQ